MAYQDPYSSQYPGGAQGYQNDYAYGYPQQGSSQDYTGNAYPQRQRTYDDVGREDFNPYDNSQLGKPRRVDEDDEYNNNTYGGTYDYPPAPQRQQTQKSTYSHRTRPSISNKASGPVYDQDAPVPAVRPLDKSPRALKAYRYDHQGNLWTKGGRGKCIGRFCCCTLMTALVLIVSIVLALALYVRPPSIKIGDVTVMPGPDGNPIQTESDGIKINLGVPISVKNPNYFSVDFDKIQADITYPVDQTPIGGGLADEVVIEKTSQTNFTFPFSLNYNSTLDPQSRVILDIGSKCGFPSGPKSNLVVNYKITLGIRILLVTISPTISNTFSFPCPLQPSDISKFITGSLGGT